MRDLAFDGEGRLHCPVCNETMGTHLDEVTMMARPDGEDGPLVARHLDDRGQLADDTAAPVDSELGEGRRHRIVIEGWCENGGHRFALIFTQHKGETYFEAKVL